MKYDEEYKLELIRQFKEINQTRRMSICKFAREKGLAKSTLASWLKNEERISSSSNGFVMLKRRSPCNNLMGISIEYYGARITCNDSLSLGLLLSCIKGNQP